ncbi:MAG: ParB/RepB/Spo0J family partition protein [Fimbriimonadaceae bacterium]|nr:ParB/RepB/Spo0J family partition protein [Fimbriimonadaceae bacterium]
MNRTGLGKGLAALLPDGAAPAGRPVMELALDAIQPNPHQPRKEFDEAALAELAASLRQHGLLQPICVRPIHGGRYQLISGERRWRAAQVAGLTTIPAMVRPANEREMLELALVENLQRENLNAMEAAEAYHRAMEEFGFTAEELAERVGKSRAAVVNTMRLLKLSPTVQEYISSGRLTEGHGRALLMVDEEGEQERLARHVLNSGLPVRQAEVLARQTSRRLGGQPEPTSGPERRERELPEAVQTALAADPDVLDYQKRLRRLFGTKVELRLERGGGGTIVIHWFGQEDLVRIAESLGV